MWRKITYPKCFSGRAIRSIYKKADLQNDFTTWYCCYPNNNQDTLHFLDKYSKSSIVSQPTCEGAKFSQKGGNMYQGGDKKPYDKITGIQKSVSVARKFTQHLIFHKTTRMTKSNKSAEEAMMTSTELFDPINQSSLISEGLKIKWRIVSPKWRQILIS